MVNYHEAEVKLTNKELNKLKSAAKNKTGIILRINKKNFQDEELPIALFLTTRQTIKIKNTFANSMPTDMKLRKAQISKITQSGGSFGSWLGNVGKKALTNVAFPLAGENLSGLVSNLTSNALSKFEKKVEKELSEQEKDLLLNEDMNNIIKIIKPVEDWTVLIDGITKTVKHEIKKTRR